MLIGQVIAPAVSTIKHVTMENQKLLMIQPMMADGHIPDGDPIVAIDQIGAGAGQSVIVTSDGRYARQLVHAKATPVRWAVVGIADEQTHG